MTDEDWSKQVSVLDYVRSFVRSPDHLWRATSTGLVRLDRPTELTSLKKMIETAHHISVHDWWVMKQVPGAPGAMLHCHNDWDTYIYYPVDSDQAIFGEDWRLVPQAGHLAYLPARTMHGVEDSTGAEREDRYSCVFLAYPKEYAYISSGEETQGQET